MLYKILLCVLVGAASAAGQEEEKEKVSVAGGGQEVLDHEVVYQPLPPAPEYRSSDEFDPRGMEHVYLIVNTFLDLILRQDVLPKSEFICLIYYIIILSTETVDLDLD